MKLLKTIVFVKLWSKPKVLERRYNPSTQRTELVLHEKEKLDIIQFQAEFDKFIVYTI